MCKLTYKHCPPFPTWRRSQTLPKIKDILHNAVVDLEARGYGSELTPLPNIREVASKLPHRWRDRVSEERERILEQSNLGSTH